MKFGERFCIGILVCWFLFAVHEGVNALVRAHNWQPMTISDWGTWVGSIGTVATLIGTIYLATSETRKRNHQELVIAALHSSAIEMRLAHAKGRLDATKMLLLAILEKQDPHPQLMKQALNLLLEIDEPSPDDLLPLAVLKNNTAIVIVRSSTALKGLRNMANVVATIPTKTDHESAQTLLLAVELNSILIGTAIESLLNNPANPNPNP
jgi:hypothetical protein